MIVEAYGAWREGGGVGAYQTVHKARAVLIANVYGRLNLNLVRINTLP